MSTGIAVRPLNARSLGGISIQETEWSRNLNNIQELNLNNSALHAGHNKYMVATLGVYDSMYVSICLCLSSSYSELSTAGVAHKVSTSSKSWGRNEITNATDFQGCRLHFMFRLPVKLGTSVIPTRYEINRRARATRSSIVVIIWNSRCIYRCLSINICAGYV